MTHLPTLRVPAHVHLLPGPAARCGWLICAGERAGGRLRAERHGRRLRVVLGERPSPLPAGARRGRLQAGAEAVVAGLPSRVMPPARFGPVLGQPPGEPGWAPPVSVVDLFPDGTVVGACRGCPSLLHLRRDGDIALLPAIPGGPPEVATLTSGERLFAFTPELLQEISPQALVDLTEVARSGGDSCALWQRFADAARGHGGPGRSRPGLVVVTRGGAAPHASA